MEQLPDDTITDDSDRVILVVRDEPRCGAVFKGNIEQTLQNIFSAQWDRRHQKSVGTGTGYYYIGCYDAGKIRDRAL